MTVGSVLSTVGRNYMNILASNGSSVLTNAYKVSRGAGKELGMGFLQRNRIAVVDSFKALNNNTAALGQGAFLKSFKSQVTGIPRHTAVGWKLAARNAAKAGKGKVGTLFAKLGGATKGLGKGLGKAMPLIGAAMTVAFELPNIVSAFKDKGFGGGVLETGKAAAKLGAGLAGAALGQAIIPIPLVGAIVGFMAGDALAKLFVGKSHSEKKLEAQQRAEIAQAQQQLQIQMPQTNPFVTAQGINYQI